MQEEQVSLSRLVLEHTRPSIRHRRGMSYDGAEGAEPVQEAWAPIISSSVASFFTKPSYSSTGSVDQLLSSTEGGQVLRVVLSLPCNDWRASSGKCHISGPVDALDPCILGPVFADQFPVLNFVKELCALEVLCVLSNAWLPQVCFSV